MFERFDDAARLAVVRAQQEARTRRHGYIGTEHILLGVVHDDAGAAVEALKRLGASLDAVRAEVNGIIGEGSDGPIGHQPFTPRAKKVLECSLREAEHLGHGYIGAEHLLLGLVREGEGVGAQVLARMGADLDGMRRLVLEVLDGRPGTSGPEASGASGTSG